MNAPTPEEVLVSRDGAIVTLTFNRPEARNAMTWGMYEKLYQTCEEVDADEAIRVLVLKGAGGKAFVAGTDISQFTKFKDGEDGIKYEKTATSAQGASRASRSRSSPRYRAMRSAAASRSPPAPTSASPRLTPSSACRPRARSATRCR